MEMDDETDDGVVLQAMDDEEEKEGEEDEMDDEDKEEEEDLLDAMDDDEREVLIENTEAVRMTLMKISFYTSIISLFLCSCFGYRFENYHSLSSIPLPLPFLHGMRPVLLILLIPHNVKTWWNSTYDMLNVAVEYRQVIDDITANKSLKMQQ